MMTSASPGEVDQTPPAPSCGPNDMVGFGERLHYGRKSGVDYRAYTDLAQHLHDDVLE